VPYIAAVDPENADALYLRTDEWDFNPDAQTARANDALLYSADAGASFVELLRKPGKLYGFTFSPDADEVMVGFGDPVEESGGRVTEPAALGIYRSAKGESLFEKRYAGSIGCLTWTAEGLYACTLEAETGFSLGLTANVDFDLAQPPRFTPLLRLQDVVGPMECGACASGAVCRNYWETTCQGWGRTDCVALTPAAPCGSGGGGSKSETPVTPPDDEGGQDGGQDEVAPSSCACLVVGRAGKPMAWVCLSLSVLLGISLGLRRASRHAGPSA
jgi:hypothetical protein